MKTRVNLKNPMKRILLHQDGNNSGSQTAGLTTLFWVFFCLLCPGQPAIAQAYFEETAPGRYRIEFKDKNASPFSLESPGDFLSEAAIARRTRQGIALHYSDLPVTPAYIDSIRATGARVLTVSKWFNAVTVIAPEDSILDKIRKLTFVSNTFQRTPPRIVSLANGSIPNIQEEPAYNYGVSGWQTAIHNGHMLHNRGYTGAGIIIAVIDAGFYRVNELPVFESLWDKGQILGTRDFVMAGADVYDGNLHGMVVLSIIGGNLPGALIGTAPDASFWLLRSKDTGSEFIIEEDNWAAAAEFADSAGAAIINTSLGYSEFTDPAMNHTYQEMDGNTTRISKAADMAASKGMLVVVSAGNQGNKDWYYISAPADADSVLAVGAIDGNGVVAPFSSRGPSSDLRIKPDVMAIGLGTWMAGWEGGILQGNGTSLSAPIITGLSACLWQANPDATAMQLLQAIRESADRYMNPDPDYGHGVPDFNLAGVLLKLSVPGSETQSGISAFPNPFINELYIIFSNPPDDAVDVEFIDLSGRIVFQHHYAGVAGTEYIKITDGIASLPKGVYMVRIKGGTHPEVCKLVKY
jgi:hypothetical protein